MSKNILKNKRSCVFILLFVLGTSVWLGGCDTAYKYDITDGIDNNGASEPDITIDTEGGIDVSMYEKARIFPGLVDTAKEERINATIELDLNKQYIDSITLGVSSGKTTLAIHAIAEAQKAGGIAAFIDAEHAFDRFYASKLGVNIDDLYISQPDNGEQALEIAEQLIRSSAIDIIVIDSVAALTPKAEIEGDMGDNKVGLQARLMSQALRKLTAAVSKTRTTCIFINQLREKIGVMFGNPETTTGGNALKFYASVRLDIRGSQPIKDGEEILGKLTKVKVVKNKVAPPFRRAEFDIMFGEGISHSGEIIDLGADLGIIKKSGSWYSYNDTKLGQGRDAAKQCIMDNPELAEELEGLIFEELKKK